MKEKANAWGNTQDRDSRFVPERKQEQTSFGSYTKGKTSQEIEPNEKFDTQQSKWTGGTVRGLELTGGQPLKSIYDKGFSRY